MFLVRLRPYTLNISCTCTPYSLPTRATEEHAKGA